MKLLGKTGLNIDQLRMIRTKGCTEFELFLNAAMIDKEYLKGTLLKFKEEMDKLGMNCHAVHTPYDSKESDYLIAFGEYNSSKTILDSVDTILEISNTILVKDGFIIYHVGCGIPIVDRTEDILHNLNELRVERFNRAEEVAEKVVRKITSTTSFKVAIENVMVFDNNKGTLMYNVIGNGYDNIRLVKNLREDGYFNVYTLLDTCHFGVSMYSMNEVDSLKEVIVKYKDTLGIMHISDGDDIALDKSKHGQPFNSCDGVIRLIDIIETLIELELDIPVTLEVVEQAFSGEDAFKNYVDTRTLAENIIKMQDKTESMQ